MECPGRPGRCRRNFQGRLVLTISSGHSASYLTDAVAAGRENYYTGAVAAGEPPGRWYGTGAERLGLVGLVDTQDMTGYRDFDVIFCRNVLIYFDDESRRIAAENLYDCLKPGGFICLGHSETMSRISPLFQVRRFPDAIVYQRPEADDV